jgi:hypothetical protein
VRTNPWLTVPFDQKILDVGRRRRSSYFVVNDREVKRLVTGKIARARLMEGRFDRIVGAGEADCKFVAAARFAMGLYITPVL